MPIRKCILQMMAPLPFKESGCGGRSEPKSFRGAVGAAASSPRPESPQMLVTAVAGALTRPLPLVGRIHDTGIAPHGWGWL